MTEDAARQWIEHTFGKSALLKLERFAAMLLDEVERQNLIAPSTTSSVWNRHIADSAQLLMLADHADGTWLDIGTGAGFPGLVVAILSDCPIILAEPRRRRSEFLAFVSEQLKLGNVDVHSVRVQSLMRPVTFISARAVASLSALFAAAEACTRSETMWILPRGKNAGAEVIAAQRQWQGMFHVEHSLTDQSAGIVVAKAVMRR